MVRVDRNLVLVAAGAEVLHLPYPLDAGVPVTGDWVWIGPNRAGDRQITGILPRRSELSRKRAFEDSSAAQVLAANMDVVGVVVPVDRPLTHNRLERTLVAAWDSGAVPLVIITKADLADVADDVVGKVILQAAGVDVITTSAENGDGIDALLAHLPPHGNLVLLGPSGAGKSTLINALVGRQVQPTGEVRAGDFKGKHTTTTTAWVRCSAMWRSWPAVAGSRTAPTTRSRGALSRRHWRTGPSTNAVGAATSNSSANWQHWPAGPMPPPAGPTSANGTRRWWWPVNPSGRRSAPVQSGRRSSGPNGGGAERALFLFHGAVGPQNPVHRLPQHAPETVRV